MRITKLWKDGGSEGGACPALYEADTIPTNYVGTDDRPGYVFQGPEVVDADTKAQLEDLGDGETAVYVPPNVIDRLVDQRLRELGS